MSHLNYAEAGVVGLLQGITELFPISSLGHAVLIPAIVGGQWAQDLNVSAKESPYLAFIVGLHVATALAAGGYSGGGRHSSGQRAMKQEHASLAIAADQRVTRLGFLSAIGLGASQILALLPGISRDGTVMVTGMFRGLSRQDAARYSFLLSAPVILAAGVLKIPDLTGPLGAGIRGPILFGSLLSGIGAYLALRFLVRYFSDPKRTLTPFAIYCLAAGAGAFIYLAVR